MFECNASPSTYAERIGKLEKEFSQYTKSLVNKKNVTMPKDAQTLYFDKRINELENRMLRIEDKLDRIITNIDDKKEPVN